MVLDYSQAVDDDDDSEGVSVDSDDSDGGFNSIVDEDDNTPLHSQFQAMSVGSSSNSRKVPYTGPSLCVVRSLPAYKISALSNILLRFAADVQLIQKGEKAILPVG